MAKKGKRGLTERGGLLGSIMRAFSPAKTPEVDPDNEPSLGDLAGFGDDDDDWEEESKTIVGFDAFDE